MKERGITVFRTFVVALLMILTPLKGEAGLPIDIPLANVEWDLSAQVPGLTVPDAGMHSGLDPWYSQSVSAINNSTESAAEASFSASNLDRAYSSSAHLWGFGWDYASSSIDVWSDNFSNMTALDISFDYDFFHSESEGVPGGQITSYVYDVTDLTETVLYDLSADDDPWSGSHAYSLGLNPDHSYYYGFEISVDNDYGLLGHTNRSAGISNLQAEVTVVPVPGAVLLGILGLSVAGVKLRKFA